MSFPTDWDVDKYRAAYESEEHWELRKRFLLKHKNKYPEDKLVCFAQVFYNVEFLGCRYPKATMNIVEKLSEGIVEEHREKMKNRLKRTFVGAADAASSKVKGLKRTITAVDEDSGPSLSEVSEQSLSKTHSNQEPSSINPITLSKIYEQSTSKTHFHQNPSNNIGRTLRKIDFTPPLTDAMKKQTKKQKNQSSDGSEMQMKPTRAATTAYVPRSCNAVLPLSERVVVYYREGDNARNQLASTKFFNKLPWEHSFKVDKVTKIFECTVLLGTDQLGCGQGPTQSIAEEAAASDVLKKLAQHCYTIVLKTSMAAARRVEKREIMDVPNSTEATENSGAMLEDPSCKANRMMKMMGWGGGGLGKDEQGRTEPVVAVEQKRRAGVGSAFAKLKIGQLKEILVKYMNSGSTDDIVFSSDFEAEERKEIHGLAHKMGLKSVSRTVKHEGRTLVISRKWEPFELLKILMDPKTTTQKYEVIPPNSGAPE